MRNNRKMLAAAVGMLLLLTAAGTIYLCKTGNGESAPDSSQKNPSSQVDSFVNSPTDTGENVADSEYSEDSEEHFKAIVPEGETLFTRIVPPEGYVRIPAEEGSLGQFLRDYPMKPDGSPVLLYDGTEKGNQSAHAAVFALPIANEDLQQCADSVMRVYAEYYWAAGQYDQIAFHFTDGFLAEYSKWREGWRIQVDGDSARWVESSSFDDSYETFCKYLRMVFAYAGTLSMEGESHPVSLQELQIGDVFLKGGSPGHVVMVVDMCENEKGQKAVLLGQGYMPAQEFHVLNNTAHPENPWYYLEEIVYPFLTPEYVFDEGSLRRLSY